MTKSDFWMGALLGLLVGLLLGGSVAFRVHWRHQGLLEQQLKNAVCRLGVPQLVDGEIKCVAEVL